eukprot:gnl/MRDRNA2_/MRDRNA2_67109_c0_seq1.p1 gnl/MRDRNA2_/MRDRNA2_67109_c0~~gnl/MRDRNA2_/MRDRNA2_67109_c0_seq1.p1  ORF type:complete len:102 (+),score=17.94 gnl/MRDRNA2_/MRDRNA2_67109_c0_seq1:28-333(+)
MGTARFSFHKSVLRVHFLLLPTAFVHGKDTQLEHGSVLHFGFLVLQVTTAVGVRLEAKTESTPPLHSWSLDFVKDFLNPPHPLCERAKRDPAVALAVVQDT